MSWQKSIEELRRRERLAEKMGGEEPVSRQKGRGKLTVRERVAFLADPGSFHEIGKIAGKATYGADDELDGFLPSNSVMGRARLNSRSTVILADDFTVRGGAADASIWQKMVQAIKMAAEYRLPLVQMIDGTGGGGSVKMLEKDPRTYIPETPGWNEITHGLTQVPFVSLALGPCAGMSPSRLAKMSPRKNWAAGKFRARMAQSTMSWIPKRTHSKQLVVSCLTFHHRCTNFRSES